MTGTAALVVLVPALTDLTLRFPAYHAQVVGLGFTRTLGLYALVISAIAILYAALLAIPRIGRWSLAAFVGSTFAAQMAFRSATGAFADLPEIEYLASSSSAVWGDALTSFSSSWTPVWVVAGICLALGVSRFARPVVGPVGLLRVAALCGLAVLSNAVLWNWLFFKHPDFPVDPVVRSVRAAAYFEKVRREFLRVPRDELSPLTAVRRPDDNIVVVLDESIRYGFLSIHDPSVGTTPFLLQLSRTHTGFRDYGLMLAASTCSSTSEAMILSGTTEAPDRGRRALRSPTIFQHARRMGYRTVLIDSWGGSFPTLFLREPDLKSIDEIIDVPRDWGATLYADLEAADHVRDLITTDNGTFVFIVKRGAHFHYESQYPSTDPAFRRFAPTLAASESYIAGDKSHVINSYKNAVSFSVDEFARRLVPDDLNNTTILWTSDHGQSLMETSPSQPYAQCRDGIEQAVVPFFVLSDSPWVRAHQPPVGDGSLTYSHHNLYPTIVSLLTKDRTVTNRGFQSVFAARPVQPPLYYLYGSLWHGSTVIPVAPPELARFRAR